MAHFRVRSAGIRGGCTHGSELEVVKAVIIEYEPSSLPAFVSATFSSTRKTHLNCINRSP